MTLQSDIQILCHDLLTEYQYDLWLKNELVKTITSEDHFRFAAVIINNGETELDLFETATELHKRYKEQIGDPNFFNKEILQN